MIVNLGKVSVETTGFVAGCCLDSGPTDPLPINSYPHVL